jgi:hypothetical protein
LLLRGRAKASKQKKDADTSPRTGTFTHHDQVGQDRTRKSPAVTNSAGVRTCEGRERFLLCGRACVLYGAFVSMEGGRVTATPPTLRRRRSHPNPGRPPSPWSWAPPLTRPHSWLSAPRTEIDEKPTHPALDVARRRQHGRQPLRGGLVCRVKRVLHLRCGVCVCVCVCSGTGRRRALWRGPNAKEKAVFCVFCPTTDVSSAASRQADHTPPCFPVQTEPAATSQKRTHT